MKQEILLFIALFVASTLAAASGLRDWSEIVSHSEDERDLRKPPSVYLEQANVGGITLRVKNETDIPLRYAGYGADRPQLFWNRKVDDEWVPAGWHWCGTGMDSYELKKGKSVEFHINDMRILTPGNAVQIFTEFRNAEEPREFSMVLLYDTEG